MTFAPVDGKGENSTLAPIALFVYRRPDHTADLLDDLTANPSSSKSRLYVFSDAPASPGHAAGVTAVRELFRDLQGFAQVRVVERPTNMGCANNIIDGVSRVLEDHDRVIVLEDDLRVSPYFLRYMEAALDRYRKRADILSVSAFSPDPNDLGMPEQYGADVYLSLRNRSCGWGTWADRWSSVDWGVGDYPSFRKNSRRRMEFDRGGNDLSAMLDDQMAGRIDSWSIRFTYAHFVQAAFSVCPRWSYIEHVGHDGSGTHVPQGYETRVRIDRALSDPSLPLDLKADERVLAALQRYYSEPRLSRMLRRLPGMASGVRWMKRRLGIRRRLLL